MVTAPIAEAFVTSTSPLMVRVIGAASDCAATALASYTPTAGDKVEVAQYGPRALIRGKTL